MKSKIEKELSKLKNTEEVYSFLLSLHLLLRAEEVPVTFNETVAMSGYPLRFLYDPNFPEAFDCSADFMVKNLSLFTRIRISEYDAENLPDRIGSFAVRPQNIFVFKDSGEVYFVDKGEIKKGSEELRGTAYAISEKKEAVRENFYSVYNLSSYGKILVSEFHSGTLHVCDREVFSGKTAFEKFISDLRNKKVSGSKLKKNTLPSFVTQTMFSGSVPVYLLGLHHFLERKLQNDLSAAIRHFEDYSMYIGESKRIAGRSADISETDRRRIANSLGRAVSSYEKGVSRLARVLCKIS